MTWSSKSSSEHSGLPATADTPHSQPLEFHLIETMRHEGSGVVKSFDAHLERLSDSARHFGFAFDSTRARGCVVDVIHGGPPSRVRLRSYRDGLMNVEVEPLPADTRTPVYLAVEHDPMDTQQCWSRHKTSLRLPYTGRLYAHQEASDVILLNERGDVMETCTSSIAACLDGSWVTPPLESGCLPGIERARLLRDGTLSENRLTLDLLERSSSLAVFNSLRGWRRGELLDDTSSTQR